MRDIPATEDGRPPNVRPVIGRAVVPDRRVVTKGEGHQRRATSRRPRTVALPMFDPGRGGRAGIPDRHNVTHRVPQPQSPRRPVGRLALRVNGQPKECECADKKRGADLSVRINGSPGGTRTPDKAVNSRLLYQLSYRGKLTGL